MADPVLSAKVASLESQLNSLKLQLRGSPGVSTGMAGAMSIRTLQLGFAAELTSTFDNATGYSWKRLRLEPPALANPGVQSTGINAFDVGGDETLESGTRVWMEPSPDAVGYLFSAGLGGDSDPACKSFLSLPECATLEVVEAYGACACIPTGQTASLTRSGEALASDDLLYGCPPGVTNADCPDGAPSKFNLVVAGFTGGSADLNGNWTLSYTATPSPRWTQTRGSVTWWASVEAGGVATLFGDNGTVSPTYFAGSVATCCESITLDLDDGGSSDDPPATLTLTPATACGAGPAYTPYLTAENDDCGPCLKLLWIPVAGSGAASVRWRMTGCGVDANGGRYAEFASASPLICSDDAEECGENYVMVRVTCACCPGNGWYGAGFYCVAESCIEINTAPCTSQDITAGPFLTDEECTCNNVMLLCCDPVVELPKQLCIDYVGTGSEASGKFKVQRCNREAIVDQWPDVSGLSCALPGDLGAFYYGRTTLSDGRTVHAAITVNALGCEWTGAIVSVPSGYPFTPPCTDTPETELLCGSVEGGVILCDLEFGYDGPSYMIISNVECGPVARASATISATDTDCESDPPAVTYNCVDGACVEVYDGSGAYATEAECTATCEGGGGGGEPPCTGDVGSTATLVIPDGPSAGTYYGVWNYLSAGVPLYVFFVGVPGVDDGEVLVAYNYSPPSPYTAGYLIGWAESSVQDGSNADTAVCGPPSVITFPGGGLSTGDITVTTP